jgi:tRNA (mo5U34)-methyltransferase
MTLESRGAAAVEGDPISAEIAELGPWFHDLHLPSGHRTAPDHQLGDFPAFKWRQIEPEVPADLSGLRALDVGCNAGYYAFALAARGADVLAIDLDEHYLRQARWAARQLDPGGRIDFRQMSVYDLVDVGEAFDLILFLGVLYHLRYPQLALDLLASRTRGRLILQTLTMPGDEPIEPPDDVPFDARDVLAEPGWPRAAFIERSLAGDPTNWWAPDDACVQAMARSAGLKVLSTPGHEIYVCERAAAGEDDPAANFRDAELRAATRQAGASSQRK